MKKIKIIMKIYTRSIRFEVLKANNIQKEIEFVFICQVPG